MRREHVEQSVAGVANDPRYIECQRLSPFPARSMDVGVVLDRSTRESFADFEKAVAKLKFVLDCHLVAGDFDYFLKIRVGDMADFNRIHGELQAAITASR